MASRERDARRTLLLISTGQVATASDQGHIVVTDRRAGRYRTSFRAHGAGIVCVKAASRHEVFTVASDGSPPPSGASRVQYLSRSASCGDSRTTEAGLRSSNVSINACMKPKPALQVLVARGHKAVALALPLGKSTPLNPIDCSRRLFVDVHGQKIPRGHLNVEACASLPARRVALLGCEDGRVRVAA